MADGKKPAKKYYVVTVAGIRRKSWIVYGWDEVLQAGYKHKIVFRGFHTQDAAKKYLAQMNQL